MKNSRNLSDINNFVVNMGGRTSDKIPVVYVQDSKNISIEKNGKITDKKTRYANGKDVVFKCLQCGEIIGKGKITEEIEDESKIYCFKCKKYLNFEKCIICSKDNLWHKPENEIQRKDYEKLINSFIETYKPNIMEK